MNRSCIPSQVPKQITAGNYRVELLPSRPYLAVYTPDAAVIGFAFESQTGVHAFASDHRTAFRTKPNSLAYVPAYCDVFSQSACGGEYLTLTFATGNSESSQHLFNNIIDPPAIEAAQCLRRLMLSGDIFDPLVLERYVGVLQERVSLVLNGECKKSRSGAWITTRRMRLVDELIDDRLGTKLTVQDLASALGLSAGFFSRALKAAIGKAPHNYIIDRRIAHARVLLDSQQCSLSTIAYEVGFSSHAHMANAFRQRLGVTPSEYRRSSIQ